MVKKYYVERNVLFKVQLSQSMNMFCIIFVSIYNLYISVSRTIKTYIDNIRKSLQLD